ncbi:MAG: ComEC/Rec2 family competence protein [Acidimicrobiales bacterium]
MTERQVVAAAVLTALAAMFAVAVPWWLVGVTAVAAAMWQRPGVVVLLLVAASSLLAARAEVGVALSGPGRNLTGVASLVTDPELRPGGAVVELRLLGRHYRAFLSGEQVTALGDASVGDEVPVVGRTAPMVAPWDWMASRHLAGRLRVRSIGAWRPGPWWWRSAGWMHRAVAQGAVSFSPDERALFLGVVFGDDRDQSALDRYRFRASGLAHLLAVSGQNVAFVIVAARPVMSRLSLRVRWPATGALLLWFALVTRLEPSVLRAVAMAIVAATAARFGRHASGVRVVAVAVIALVLVDPMLVWSTGFRLSVAASVALVVLARPLLSVLPGRPTPITEALAVSLAAQVGTAPLIVSISGSVPLAAPLTNLFAVPVAGWLMVWGVVTGPLAGVVGEPWASLLGWPSRWMVRWVAWVARMGAAPSWPRIGWWGVLATTALVAAALLGRYRPSLARGVVVRVVVASALVLLVLDLVMIPRLRSETQRGSVTIWAEGDAAVMLLGSRSTESKALDAVLAARRARLDVVVVTGGGRTSSAVVYSLRQVVDVGTVVAADPPAIRSARRLRPGAVIAGPVRVDVERDDAGRWTVRGPPGSGRDDPV